MKPYFDCNFTFLIDFAPKEIPFGAKSKQEEIFLNKIHKLISLRVICRLTEQFIVLKKTMQERF